MERLNLGCGFDVKEGWTNVDRVIADGVEFWDIAKNVVPENWKGKFDFILLNHVLLCFSDYEVPEILQKVRECLAPNGRLHVIDMDLLRVFNSYRQGRIDDIPIDFGEIDDRLCEAVSGYGTRKSVYTPLRLEHLLDGTGYRNIERLTHSQYDTRPKESLIMEASR